MSTSIYSQNSVTFYKDAKCSIVSPQLKAKYELTETVLNDSTIKKNLYR